MSDYEKEIDKMMDILKDYPEALRKMLINYDKLVKARCNQTDLVLPYWCYGFCGCESLDEIVKSVNKGLEVSK